jgi:hypothetical protein
MKIESRAIGVSLVRIVGERAIISAQLVAVRGKWTQFAEMRGDPRDRISDLSRRPEQEPVKPC